MIFLKLFKISLARPHSALWHSESPVTTVRLLPLIQSTIAPNETATASTFFNRRTLNKRKEHKFPYMIYLILVGLIFTALTIVFLFFPRSEYSELEKRDLAKFPDTNIIKNNPSEFTSAISSWFSDSEPYRDVFMTLSMQIRDLMRCKVKFGNDEIISYKPAEPLSTSDTIENNDEVEKPEDNPLADENAKLGNSGTIIVGSGEDIRALMIFGGGEKAGTSFISMVNDYSREFPNQQIYALVAPIATEFYLPDKAKKLSNPEKPMIDYVKSNISENVKFVDVYSSLAAHTHEDIYLRTDHHWAPLGAFYAARQLAKTAGVPFKDLDAYDRHVVKNFVGSMYGYTKDIAVKNAPENFVYYTPRNLDYRTTYITYYTDKNYQITSQTKPYTGRFFHQFKDGSSGAYSTFMGGDQHLVKVETGTPGTRRLLIIKDSYGNALPGYMFYSFNEVHVVDFRYFKENMRDYVSRNKITDIVIAVNVFNACSSSVANKIKKYINQPAGDFSTVEKNKDKFENVHKKDVNHPDNLNTTENITVKKETSQQKSENIESEVIE